MTSEKTYEGSCFCGAVELTVTGEPEAMGFCHCTSCRHWSAGPMNGFSLWKPQALKVTKGGDNIGTYNKTPVSFRKWCKTCGGHLFTDHPTFGMVDIYAAMLPTLRFEPGGSRSLRRSDGEDARRPSEAERHAERDGRIGDAHSRVGPVTRPSEDRFRARTRGWARLLLIAAAAAASACDEKGAPPSPGSTPAPSAAPAAVDAAPPAAASAASIVPTQIAAQHILVAYRGADRAPAGVARSKAAAKARAAEVEAKAKAGGDFSALVAEYSDDPGAKERMGSVGKFSRDKMEKAFSDAAFQLRVDEVSDVVETRFGFHVIKRNQ